MRELHAAQQNAMVKDESINDIRIKRQLVMSPMRLFPLRWLTNTSTEITKNNSKDYSTK